MARGQRSRPEGAYFYLAARRGVCPIQVQGTIRGPALSGGRGRGERACWGQVPEQRRSAWPRAKLGAMSSTAGIKHNTPPGRLRTTLRSLTVIHLQPPGSRRLHEQGPSFLELPARSMVWPTSPGALACSWCVVFPGRCGGLEASAIRPAGWIGTAVGLMNVEL